MLEWNSYPNYVAEIWNGFFVGRELWPWTVSLRINAYEDAHLPRFTTTFLNANKSCENEKIYDYITRNKISNGPNCDLIFCSQALLSVLYIPIQVLDEFIRNLIKFLLRHCPQLLLNDWAPLQNPTLQLRLHTLHYIQVWLLESGRRATPFYWRSSIALSALWAGVMSCRKSSWLLIMGRKFWSRICM